MGITSFCVLKVKPIMNLATPSIPNSLYTELFDLICVFTTN